MTIAVCAGDMFRLPGAFVVGATTTFDTDISSGLISPKSVQGQFTALFYDTVAHLDADLTTALAGVVPERIIEAGSGKKAVYPVGTTVRLTARGRTAYLVAIASLNEYGVAHSSFEDLKNALPRLWEAVGERGTFEPLVMPVLGSGFSRLPQTREELAREIIKSFTAACSSGRPTEALTIVLPYDDFYEHRVDLTELELYLQHMCRYTEFKRPQDAGAGRSVT